MDIDIDLPPSFDPKKLFPEATYASMVNKDDMLVKHNVGVYFQNVPKDPITDLCAVPFREAEKIGFFKIDFLHLDLLKYFGSKKEIRILMRKTPNWSLLLDKNVVSKLFHLSKHYSILQLVRPTSVQEVADCIALKLPSKRNLLNPYLRNRNQIRETQLYRKPVDNTQAFKKGHAVAYAYNVVLQLHMINAGIA